MEEVKNKEESSEVLSYLPLVKKIAARFFGSLPPQIEFDDIVGYGVLGLLEAFRNYEPERKVKFSTYAFYRIRGAILDGLRQLDWLTRRERGKIRRLEAAVEELENSLGRRPQTEELANYLKMDAEDIDSLLSEAQESQVLLLEEDLEKVTSFEWNNSVIEDLQRQELIRLLGESVRELDERERLILSLYYYEDLNLKEIAKVLDLGESRISQLLSKAISSLRKKMRQMI